MNPLRTIIEAIRRGRRIRRIRRARREFEEIKATLHRALCRPARGHAPHDRN